MNLLNTIFIAVGAAAAAATFAQPVQAQSGHALVLAEKACFDQGIRPNTAALNKCVDRWVDGDARPAKRPSIQSQTYRVRPAPTNPQYYEEYVAPSRVSYRY